MRCGAGLRRRQRFGGRGEDRQRLPVPNESAIDVGRGISIQVAGLPIRAVTFGIVALRSQKRGKPE